MSSHQVACTDGSIRNVRSLLILRVGLNAVGVSLPALASILAFIVYGINHSLDPATIFTSLTSFTMLRTPLMYLREFPRFACVLSAVSDSERQFSTATALSASVDAYSTFGRIQEVFEAESLPGEQTRDPELENALELDNASFSWDAPPDPASGKDKGKGKGGGKEPKEPKKDKKDKKKPKMGTDATTTPTSGVVPSSFRVPTSQEPEKTERVFKIKNTNLTVPKGQIIAMVGPVGSGKSSFLQGLIGEMRRETGSVKFGGSVSYCPQNAWIQV